MLFSHRVIALLLALFALLLLSACGETEAEVLAPASTQESQQTAPDNPGGLYLTDFLTMTVSDVTGLWGDDIVYLDGWYWGASKYFYYEDGRVPYTFSFLDEARTGAAEGSEPVDSVTYLTGKGGVTMVAPELSVSATYPDLTALGLEGVFSTEVSPDDEFHAGAAAYFDCDYGDALRLTFLWLEGSSPETDPPDSITVLRPPESQESGPAQSGQASASAGTPAPATDSAPASTATSFSGVMGSRFMVPAGFVQEDIQAAQGYLYSFFNANLDMTISVSEQTLLSLPATPEEDYARYVASYGDNITYSFQGEGRYVLSGYSGDNIFYRAVFYDEALSFEVYFLYPRSAASACDPIVEEFMAGYQSL